MSQLNLLNALSTIGPMTRLELENVLKLSNAATAYAIQQLRLHKHIHICGYERQPEGLRGGMAPIYKLGDKPDAPKPKAYTRQEIDKRYREKHSLLISMRRYKNYRKQLHVWSGLML